MLNKFMGIGRLGSNPEIKYSPSGLAVLSFSIACSEKFKDKQGQWQEKTEWVNVKVWGKQAEMCQKYIFKGSNVFIEGKLSTQSWDGKDGVKRYKTEVVANVVRFLDSKKQEEKDGDMLDKDYKIQTDTDFTSDDIPF